MPKWKGTFDAGNKIAEPAITYTQVPCDCPEKEIEVNPDALSQFCIPTFNEKIIPYQNLEACGRPDIQEIDIPIPHCWEDTCFDHCTRLPVEIDHCQRKVIC